MLFLPVLYASDAAAHHSNSGYDREKQITVTGELTEVQWANPHVYIYIKQKLDDGSVISWTIEGFNPAGMRRIGFDKDTLTVGDKLTIIGNPSRNSAKQSIYPNEIFKSDTKLLDEKEFFAKALSEPTLPDVGVDTIEGIWNVPLTPSIIVPGQSVTKVFDLTSQGSEVLEKFNEQSMNPGMNYIQIPAPLIMHFGDLKNITISDRLITIQSDYDGGERKIHLDVTTHDDAPYTNQGHSIGHWEKRTLIVDTAKFSVNNFGVAFGIPSSTKKRLHEKFTLSDDGKFLIYYFELTDPTYLASPLSYETKWVLESGSIFQVDDCNIDNAQRFLENF